MEQFKRTEMLVGRESLGILQNSNILLVGTGGVGGYIAEFLIRTGIGNLTIVDFDIINITNLNRQIIALQSTLNLSKVETLKNRLLDINPKANITALNVKLDKDNVDKIVNMSNFDYIIDAIDILSDKVELICSAKKHNKQIISALGAGNKIEMPNFKILDIYQTYNDGLARVLRKKLRERNINSLDVCCSVNNCVKPIENSTERNVGSIVYYPAMSACLISAYVVNKLL